MDIKRSNYLSRKVIVDFLFFLQIIKSRSKSIKKMKQDSIVARIQQAKTLISKNSLQLKSFVCYLDNQTFKKQKKYSDHNNPQVSSDFARAYDTFNEKEKLTYYLSCLQTILFLSTSKTLSHVPSMKVANKNQIDLLFRFKKNVHDWKKITCIMDQQKTTLDFGQLGRINFQNYIIRNSKSKNRLSLVVQKCQPCQSIQTLWISSVDEKNFNQFRNKIESFYKLALNQKIAKIMKQQLSKSKIDSKSQTVVSSIKGKIKQQFSFDQNTYKNMISDSIKEKMIQQIDDFISYQEVDKGVYYHLEKPKVKIVKKYSNNKDSIQNLVNKLLDINTFKRWKPALFMVTRVSQIPQKKSSIFHQVSVFKQNADCDLLYVRNCFQKGQQFYCIDRSISDTTEENYPRNSINCIWRMKPISEVQMQILVQCQMSQIDCNNIYEVICEQIGDVDRWVQLKTSMRSQISSQTPQKSSVVNAVSSNQTPYQQQTQNRGDQLIQFYSIYSNRNSFRTQFMQNIQEHTQKKPQKDIKQTAYCYQLTPSENSLNQLVPFKEDNFFPSSQAKLNEKGELVFTNLQKINAQSSVLKTVLKRIGTNLFSGKSILNISLPVTVFSKQTNLQKMCKSLAYAPHFLQNKINDSPLQRMKATVCFLVGSSLLYIQMAKPFNPILGQTYQGFIDGCPIYGEQTSHHPPISSVLLYGRGYIVHASLQAKVNFGLNSASGINQGYYYVAFDNKDPRKNAIQYNGPPGEMQNIIFGERKLVLTNKTRLFDQTSQVFCELSWGKSSSSQEQAKYHDYFQGKIVKLNKFQKGISNITVHKQDQILGFVSGRWNDKIYCDGKLIYDVNKLYPFKVQSQPRPLGSDVQYRKDRNLLIRGTMEQSQNAKQELEEIQRRDRKLRKKYQKS